MSTPEKNDIDAQEIPLEQLSEVAGGARGGSGGGGTHGDGGGLIVPTDGKGNRTAKGSGRGPVQG